MLNVMEAVMAGSIDVSIVIPVRNEEDSIPVLFEEIYETMMKTDFTWECIWIDDGSTDDSFSRLKDLNGKNPGQHCIRFKKNYGQSAALSAGFRFAKGRVIATLDGDLQNDPKDIPRLIETLYDSEVQMVNGYRRSRNDSLIRRISSRIANGFRNRVTRSDIKDVGCSMRVFYREVVDGIPVFKGMHRFLPTLASINGYRSIEVPVVHRKRKYGKTKYGIHDRLWVGIADTLAVRWMQNRFINPEITEKL